MKFTTVPINDVPKFNSNGDSYRPLVLVVDDESAIADTLVQILTRSGFSAVAAYDGQSALETALLMPPHLLLTDVSLPGMNGIDLAITLRRIYPDCKVILFSGQASTMDLLGSANRSGHHFQLLHKPIHPSELLVHLKASLKTSSARAAVPVT